MRNSFMTGALGRVGAVAATMAVTAIVYLLAQGRDRAAVQVPAVPAWNQGRAVEGPGIEGVFTAQGLQVTAIEGRARQWGLQIGDVILTVAGRPMSDAAQLGLLIAGTALELFRNGAPVRLVVTDAATAVDARPVVTRGLSGQLTPEGLWVSGAQGEAAAWGLRVGDLVRSVDGRPLTVRRDALSMLNSLDAGRGFAFEVVRAGTRLVVAYPQAAPQSGFAGWLTGR